MTMSTQTEVEDAMEQTALAEAMESPEDVTFDLSPDFSEADDAFNEDYVLPKGTSGYSSDELEEDDEDINNGEDSKDEDTGNQWLSKNKTIMWSPTHDVAKDFHEHPIPTPGPTCYALARVRSLQSTFHLFFTDDIIQRLVDTTNSQEQKYAASWTPLTVKELRTFLGLLILAGIYRSKHEATFRLWETKTGRPIFSQTMPHYRFSQINRALRFDGKPRHQHQDKLDHFLDIWGNWNDLLPKMFNLERDICVDEQLVSFRGRCSFKQYMPSKPAKYGLKIWTLCDVATSYAWNMQIYMGKPAEGDKDKNLPMRVVLDLCEMLEGHTVITDKFFTSFPLADQLKKQKMALVGTICKNKMDLPPQLLNISRRQPLSSVFAFSPERTLVSYVPKKGKNILLFSTKHRTPEVSQLEKKKPQMILDYNKCKGAVDLLSHACGTYSCRQRSSSWTLCLFYHMVDITCYNAYVIYTTINPDWNAKSSFKRRLFLEELGIALILGQWPHTDHAPISEDEAEDTDEQKSKPPVKRGPCGHCTNTKRARNVCKRCGDHICKKHVMTICSNCYGKKKKL